MDDKVKFITFKSLRWIDSEKKKIGEFSKTYLELIFDLCEFFSKNASFFSTGVNLFLENLSTSLKNLNKSRLTHITDVMAFVIKDYALGTDVNLVILAEEFGALIWVLEAILLCGLLLSLHLLFFLLG